MNQNNFNLNNQKPAVAYTEIELQALITDIIPKKDKNNKDFWVIKAQIDEWTNKSYLCFSSDYKLDSKTGFLLLNSKEKLLDKFCRLKIRSQDGFNKVVGMEVVKG